MAPSPEYTQVQIASLLCKFAYQTPSISMSYFCKLAIIGEDAALLAYRYKADGSWIAGALLQGGKCEPNGFNIHLPEGEGSLDTNSKIFMCD